MKGVGEAAVESIIAERNANGRFKDIYDLMERVNFSAVNRKCFENLAYAGGFDSISGFHRGKFFGADARDNTGVTFIEQLMRYGQRFQAEKNNAQQSLFGGGGHVDIQRPVLPACADWSQLETLAKEREMIGHYLSAHPLDDYKIIINHMCKTQLTELENLEALKGQEIAVAGMVVSVQNLITKTGKPWGKFKLEDYNGGHDFASSAMTTRTSANTFSRTISSSSGAACRPSPTTTRSWNSRSFRWFSCRRCATRSRR